MILMSGYHGYPDWFATEDGPENGVPEFMKDYVKVIPWGNMDMAESLIKKYNERIACVISIPYDLNEDTSGNYVRHLRKLTTEYGILLVLDEILTGFRLALGGAQEYFGVDADLASYAKAMANGYPISAYVGRRKYMQQLDKFKMTTTYAGETLSIAASLATINIMKRENVQQHLWGMGRRLMEGFDAMAKDLGIQAHAAGLAPASFLKFNTGDAALDGRLQYLWFRELFREGVFIILRWFISYSHKLSDIDETLDRARRALKRALDAEPKERSTINPFYW